IVKYSLRGPVIDGRTKERLYQSIRPEHSQQGARCQSTVTRIHGHRDGVKQFRSRYAGAERRVVKETAAESNGVEVARANTRERPQQQILQVSLHRGRD